jgi:hypothetical protein
MLPSGIMMVITAMQCFPLFVLLINNDMYGMATSKPIKFKASSVLPNQSNLHAALSLLLLD